LSLPLVNFVIDQDFLHKSVVSGLVKLSNCSSIVWYPLENGQNSMTRYHTYSRPPRRAGYPHAYSGQKKRLAAPRSASAPSPAFLPRMDRAPHAPAPTCHTSKQERPALRQPLPATQAQPNGADFSIPLKSLVFSVLVSNILFAYHLGINHARLNQIGNRFRH